MHHHPSTQQQAAIANQMAQGLLNLKQLFFQTLVEKMTQMVQEGNLRKLERILNTPRGDSFQTIPISEEIFHGGVNDLFETIKNRVEQGDLSFEPLFQKGLDDLKETLSHAVDVHVRNFIRQGGLQGFPSQQA